MNPQERTKTNSQNVLFRFQGFNHTLAKLPDTFGCIKRLILTKVDNLNMHQKIVLLLSDLPVHLTAYFFMNLIIGKFLSF